MEQKQLTYSELTRFFLPIAAMTMIMMSSHNVISWSLSQMLAPAIALTAYSVGQSVSSIVQAPIWALVKLTTATANSRVSTENLMKVAWQVCIIVILIMCGIAFTPLGKVVFVDLMGVSEDVLPATLWAFRIFLIMPVFGIYRATHQGFVVLRKKTIWLTFGTSLRIGSMFIIALFFTKTKMIDGGVVGSIILTTGFLMEALVNFFKGRPWIKEVPEEDPYGSLPQSTGSIWIFFIPLILAQIVNSFVNPGISAGLARTSDPEIAISAFFVARSLAWIFLSLGFRVHQLVLVFVRDNYSWRKVSRFVGMLSIIMTIAMAILALTPVGAWTYTHILQVDPSIATEALKTLVFFTALPLFVLFAELYQGLLLKERRSKAIILCKVSNVGVLFAVLFYLIRVAPQLGSAIGGISILASYLVEVIISYFLVWKTPLMRSHNKPLVS